MDEPFSALDALTNLRMRNELLRILEEERHTVMLITHDVEEAILSASSRIGGVVAETDQNPGDVQRGIAASAPVDQPRSAATACCNFARAGRRSECGMIRGNRRLRFTVLIELALSAIRKFEIASACRRYGNGAGFSRMAW